MSKLEHAELVDGVREELITYLQNGTVNKQAVARTLDITELGIDEIDRLKRIHFCLSSDVVDFIETLQGRLRRIKTANQRDREITRGEVRGGIDWQATTRVRYTESAGDRTRFACKTPYTEYDIGENLVLKKLLWLVHSTVQEDISDINYDWRREAWPTERIAMFDRIYARNVHLNRIRDGEDIRVTRRMLNTARTARQSLYTDAYRLYDRYRRLLAGKYEDEDVSQLLSNTLVIPERLPRLFELFCIFQLLRCLSSRGLRLQPIESGAKQLAILESDQYTVDIYHDQNGGLSFHVPLSELEGIEADYIDRYQNVQRRHGELVDAFLGNDTQPSLFSGRPDLVLEVYESRAREVLTAVVLGEIKYSDNQQTFTRGLEELLKYIEFAQYEEYLSDLDIDIQGLIISDGVETNRDSPLDGEVTHISASDLISVGYPESWIPTQIR